MTRTTAGKPVPKWMAGKYYSEEELHQMMKHSHDPIPIWKLQKKIKGTMKQPKFKVGDIMRTLQEAKDGWTDGMPVVVGVDKEYYHCNNEIIPIASQDEYEYPPMNRKED